MNITIEENKDQELRDFAKNLERKIECERMVLFSFADNSYQKAENSEILRKEEELIRGFDYKKSISKLILNLIEMKPEKRKNIMNYISNYRRINYRLNGVFINRSIGKPDTILLADFAEDPLKYF